MGTIDKYGVNRFTLLDFRPQLTVLATLKNGAEVLFRKPLRDHPMDNFLEIVLCWWEGKFVTWTLNIQDGGGSDGSYFDPSEWGAGLKQQFIEALKDFDERGIPTNYTPRAMECLGVKEAA